MRSVRLAIDVNSGDFGTRVLLEGVCSAISMCPVPFHARLCGDSSIIERELAAIGPKKIGHDSFSIENCTQSIEQGEKPSRVWKTRRFSSVIRCIALQKEGEVDASVSAGDTGVLMGAAIFLLGRSEYVSRPALAALLPTTSNRPSLVLDVGANLECRSEHLVSFGRMGFDYYSRFFNIESPRVALLNIGHEPSKGTRTISEAGHTLAEECPGYCGFVEGGKVLSGEVDVVVCDGFTGNVLLKACESFHRLTESVLADSKRLLHTVKKKMAILNSEYYGAVPFMGIQGVVFKAHGSSSAKAFAHALVAAVNAVSRIKTAIS